MIYNTNRKSREVYGIHFYGNEASDYGKEQGYVDYRTFARAFDAVMNNSIMQELESAGYYFEPVQDGSSDYSDEIDELRDAADELEAEADTMEEEADEMEQDADDADNQDHADELRKNASELRKNAEQARNDAEKKRDRADDLESEQEPPEIFQFFIVDDAGAEIIQEWTDDPLFYCESLDMYIWGVTHWGTSWDYVLTDIRLNAGEEVFK